MHAAGRVRQTQVGAQHPIDQHAIALVSHRASVMMAAPARSARELPVRREGMGGHHGDDGRERAPAGVDETARRRLVDEAGKCEISHSSAMSAVGVEGCERLLAELPVDELERHVEALAQQRRESDAVGVRQAMRTRPAASSRNCVQRAIVLSSVSRAAFAPSRNRAPSCVSALSLSRSTSQAKLAFEVRDMGAQVDFAMNSSSAVSLKLRCREKAMNSSRYSVLIDAQLLASPDMATAAFSKSERASCGKRCRAGRSECPNMISSL